MTQEGWKLEQEEAPCTPPAVAPSLCSNNCGFFGSATTMNLCSSCYKTLVLLKATSPTQIPPPVDQSEPQIKPDSSSSCSSASTSSSSSSSLPTTAVSPSASSSAAAAETSTTKKTVLSLCFEKSQPVRCFACHKKAGLRGFKCHCGDVFCASHRYSDKHACSFDYKAAGRASIAKANPIVKAEKLHRI